jgi:hypothetical protein
MIFATMEVIAYWLLVRFPGPEFWLFALPLPPVFPVPKPLIFVVSVGFSSGFIGFSIGFTGFSISGVSTGVLGVPAGVKFNEDL